MVNGDIFRLPKTRLHPEVMDTIIDCLRGDRETLRSCAAACKAFFRRSRYNLFQSIHLSTHSELMRLARLSRKYPKLFHLFCELRISDTLDPCGECTIAQSAPLVLAHLLHQVKSLTLEGLELHALLCVSKPSSARANHSFIS